MANRKLLIAYCRSHIDLCCVQINWVLPSVHDCARPVGCIMGILRVDFVVSAPTGHSAALPVPEESSPHRYR